MEIIGILFFFNIHLRNVGLELRLDGFDVTEVQRITCEQKQFDFILNLEVTKFVEKRSKIEVTWLAEHPKILFENFFCN